MSYNDYSSAPLSGYQFSLKKTLESSSNLDTLLNKSWKYSSCLKIFNIASHSILQIFNFTTNISNLCIYNYVMFGGTKNRSSSVAIHVYFVCYCQKCEEDHRIDSSAILKYLINVIMEIITKHTMNHMCLLVVVTLFSMHVISKDD